MKNLLFTTWLVSCPGFLVQAQCEVIPEIATAYDHQARIIALDEMLNSGTADTNSIRIPELYVTPVLEHLSAIYNSAYTAEADSIFNIYCINNPGSDENGGYTSRTIYVELDTSASWTAPWLNEQIPSGHPFIDSLLEGLPYEIELYIPSLLTGVVKITFEDIINLPALVSMLDTMQGVRFAERTPLYGDGNKVNYYFDGENYHVTFNLGWDDCFSGCISQRTWYFIIAPGCYAELLFTFGSPVTFWFNEPPHAPNCNLVSGSSEVWDTPVCKIFPNPAHDFVHIQSDTPIHWVSLYSSLGVEVQYEVTDTADFEIDISSLPAGLYFMLSNHGQVTRFIKN